MARPAADSVRVEWTGTGTGTMSLGSPVAAFQGFPAALNGEIVSYSIEHQSEVERENGLGTYTSSGNSLSRDFVSFSTNGGAKVNFSGGTKHVRLTALALDVVEHRDTVDPTATDDIDSGFIRGRSRWLNTSTSKLFFLIDDQPGGAAWQELGAGGGGGDVSTTGTPATGEYARFTDSTTIEGRSSAEVKDDLAITINVADFGAVGDGVTSDAAAINAAISDLGSRGGRVLFEAKDYLVNAEITVPNGVRLEGVYGDLSSLGTRIQLTGGAKIDLGGSRGAELAFLRIESDSTTVPAVDFDDEDFTASYPAIDRCNIIGGSACIRFNNCLEARVNRCRLVTIAGSTNVVLLDGRDGNIENNKGIDAVEFVQCVFGSALEATADLVDANGDVASIKFTQCVLLFGNRGLVLRKVGGTTDRAPRFFYFVGGGFENGNGAAVDVSAGSLIKFANFYASNDAPSGVSGDIMRLGSGGDFVVSSGEVRGGARDGIRVFNGSNATITGCHIGNNARAETGVGVRISAAGRVVLAGNNIGAFSDGTNNQTHGVGLTSQVTPVTIVGNDLGDNATGALTGSVPADSVLANNRGLAGSSDAASIRGVNVTTNTPSDGELLVYRDALPGYVLETKPAGGSNPALADITDVTITSVADQEVLAFDSGSGEWVNHSFVSGDAGNDLTVNPKFWVGTQAEFDALTPDSNTIYNIIAS